METKERFIKSLFEHSVKAYRAGDISSATETFSELISHEPKHWEGKMYLSMCYFKSKMYSDANKHCLDIVQHCPVEHLKIKANESLTLLNKVHANSTPQKTNPALKPIQKPASVKTKEADDSFDGLEWVDERISKADYRSIL